MAAILTIVFVILVGWLYYVSINNIELISSYDRKVVISYIVIPTVVVLLIKIIQFLSNKPNLFQISGFIKRVIATFFMFFIFIIVSFPVELLVLEFLSNKNKELLISMSVGIVIDLFILLFLLAL